MPDNFQTAINSDTPVLVDFFATWCGPCKTMAPYLKQAKEALGDSARIIKIDIDKNREAAKAFQIQGVPTLIIFKNGKVMWRQSGVISAGEIIKQVRAHI